MTLHVHRAQRADALAAGLAETLRAPGSDVFGTELVVVPARGIERWLTQSLAHELGTSQSGGAAGGGGDGICAGVEFLMPWEISRRLLGTPRQYGWAPDRLVWPLLGVIDEAGREPWLRTVGVHLGLISSRAGEEGDAGVGHHLDESQLHRRGRRYAVARRLAGLFDSYAAYRPGMLSAWREGQDHDGYSRPLPPDLNWQPELWRRLLQAVPELDPVALLDQWRADGAVPADVPQRLSYFGPTRITSRDLQLLCGLAASREVHLWLPHPSPSLWDRLAELNSDLSGRASDPTILLPRHRLLSALGRDSRELQLALSAAAAHAGVPVVNHLLAPARNRSPVGAQPETGQPGTTAVETLLGRLQRDIAGDFSPGAAAPVTLAPSDLTIQVHACHGPLRQVEVLRDVITGLLADDPTLEPRDILVMCPEIDLYAPLIAASFGLGETAARDSDSAGRGVPPLQSDQSGPGGDKIAKHPAHSLRVNLADRSAGRTNPVLATLERLLDLTTGRGTATEILDLLALPPVRRRFEITDEALERITSWTRQAAIRWGLDSQQRSRFQMEAIPQGTWRTGLDRLLLGVTMADEGDQWLGVTLPLDDVGSSEIDLAGRFAEFVERVGMCLDGMAGEHSMAVWAARLGTSLDLLTDVPETHEWQAIQARGLLADLAEESTRGTTVGDTPVLVGAADIKSLFRYRLRSRPTRANFRTGGLTFCTMVPMRSVPQRVICLLGLDDGVFPRSARQDGDDILARHPMVGERDVRGEDRQLLLDALLAATDSVVITYSGNDERTGSDRPPAVPVGELLDTIDDMGSTAAGSAARTQVLIRHPLQPFDSRNFTDGALLPKRAFSFDRASLVGAQVAHRNLMPAPFIEGPLVTAQPSVIELVNLRRLLARPAGGFLEQRLLVAVPVEPDAAPDRLPVELDGLQKYELGRRLLEQRLAGREAAVSAQSEFRRGFLPPGPLGTAILGDLMAEVDSLVTASAEVRSAPLEQKTIVAALPGGREIRGTIGVHGSTIVSVTYSKLSALHRLQSWIELICLSRADPGRNWQAVTIGRGSTGRPQQITLGPLDPEMASEVLVQLVDLYDRGLREPLPMALKTSAAYAIARRNQSNVGEAQVEAAQRWHSGQLPGENSEPAHIRVWGAQASFVDLLTAPVRLDEQWAGEPTRFGELAVRLWEPILRQERLQWL